MMPEPHTSARALRQQQASTWTAELSRCLAASDSVSVATECIGTFTMGLAGLSEACCRSWWRSFAPASLTLLVQLHSTS